MTMAKRDVDVRRVHEDMVDVGDTVKLERGPQRITAVATEQLLDNMTTAPHYFAPTRVKTPTGVQEVSARDAEGKPIRLGESMTYLDWMTPRDQQGWYLYEREPREVFVNDDDGYVVEDKSGEPQMRTEENNWEERGYFRTYDEALAAARRLVGG